MRLEVYLDSRWRIVLSGLHGADIAAAKDAAAAMSWLDSMQALRWRLLDEQYGRVTEMSDPRGLWPATRSNPCGDDQ